MKQNSFSVTNKVTNCIGKDSLIPLNKLSPFTYPPHLPPFRVIFVMHEQNYHLKTTKIHYRNDTIKASLLYTKTLEGHF